METKSKRGRKPKVIIESEQIKNKNEEDAKEEPIKKKRGRKKKWETEDNSTNNYSSNTLTEMLTFNSEKNKDKDLKDFNKNSLCFGNLKIEILKKDNEPKNYQDFFNDNEDECDLYISDEEIINDDKKNNYDTYNKSIKLFKNKIENKIVKNDIRCYYCHHNFDNKPFYLPFEHCSKTDRFRLTGNFCSPNCVKTFCLKSKTYENKLYLVGFFYRKLFGQDFNIKPAPDIYNLKEYGGNMTIEEFRKSFYNNDKYIIDNVNSKIVKITS